MSSRWKPSESKHSWEIKSNLWTARVFPASKSENGTQKASASIVFRYVSGMPLNTIWEDRFETNEEALAECQRRLELFEEATKA